MAWPRASSNFPLLSFSWNWTRSRLRPPCWINRMQAHLCRWNSGCPQHPANFTCEWCHRLHWRYTPQSFGRIVRQVPGTSVGSSQELSKGSDGFGQGCHAARVAAILPHLLDRFQGTIPGRNSFVRVLGSCGRRPSMGSCFGDIGPQAYDVIIRTCLSGAVLRAPSIRPRFATDRISQAGRVGLSTCTSTYLGLNNACTSAGSFPFSGQRRDLECA